MDIRNVLERLCAVGAPSGFERPASQIAVELLRPLVDEISADRLGNVIGLKKCGKPNAKKLLLDAHLDEIGLIVTGIEEGFLRFRTIGGVDPRMLLDREVTILTDPPLYGVIACLPPHVQTAENLNRSIPIDKLFIDVGMNQEQTKAAIPIGTPIVYRESCFSLGEKQLCGKAMDDRACFACILLAAELLQDRELDVDLYIMGSTREEVSGAGAKVGAFALEPDFCVVVDVTHGKTPDSPKDRVSVMGEGPAIGIGPNMSRWMTERMRAKAREEDIPFQLEVMEGNTGTNGWYVQTVREGIATSLVSLPLKYMHTPIEVLDLSDIDAVARLLAAVVIGLGKETETPC